VSRESGRQIGGDETFSAILLESSVMTDVDLHIRCQRCGTQMDMRDPGQGMPWTPDQFWVCPRCGRHFWTTYPPPNREKAKPAQEPVS
jgi:ribosomal protein L37E